MAVVSCPATIMVATWSRSWAREEARVDDLVHEGEPAGTEPAAGEVAQVGHRGRQDHVQQVGPAEAAAEADDEAAKGGAVLLHLEREYRAARDLQREELHE